MKTTRAMNREETDWTVIDSPLVEESSQKEILSSSKRLSNKSNESIFRDI